MPKKSRHWVRLVWKKCPVSSVPGVPGHTHILADQLTLFQPGGTDYAHLITTGTPGCLDLPMALVLNTINVNLNLFQISRLHPVGI